MWQAWIDVLIGVWVALAPFVHMDVSTVKFNNMIMGSIALLVSYLLPKKKGWERWVGMIFGLWIFIAACIPGLTTGSAYFWNNYGSGVLIAFAGLFSVRKWSVEITRLLDISPKRLAGRHSAEKESSTSRKEDVP